MPDKQKSERRNKTRVSFDAQIKLKLSDVEIDSFGNSRDMSLNGIFINTDLRPEIGKKCDVEVILTGGVDDLRLFMRGIVTRHGSKGIGINFNSMGLESYTHLKNIVRYNVNSASKES